jgi:hypothetical protein
MKSIKFSYPRRGLTGEFNTFRLGAKLSQELAPGEVVELIDARTSKLLKRATVTGVHTGQLVPMAQQHAHLAHNWKEHPEAERSSLLVASLKKRYPPGRARDDSVVTVVYMREEHEPNTPPVSG